MNRTLEEILKRIRKTEPLDLRELKKGDIGINFGPVYTEIFITLGNNEQFAFYVCNVNGATMSSNENYGGFRDYRRRHSGYDCLRKLRIP